MDDIEALVVRLQAAETPLLERHEAFAEIVRRFQDMAYGCAYALLGDRARAQDAAQEAFIVAYRDLGQLRDARAFAGWFRRIVLSQCHRQTRGPQAGEVPLAADAELPVTQPGPAALAERADLRERIRRAVLELPPSQREATVLYYVDGYSQQEVAAFLEVPVEVAKKRLQRARGRLRERLMDMVQDELQEERPSNDERFLQSVIRATALENAALEGVTQMLEAFLVDGLDVNVPNREGQTLLHWAAQKGILDAVDLLLRGGADPAIADVYGKTPLQWAEEKGFRQVAGLIRGHQGRGAQGG